MKSVYAYKKGREILNNYIKVYLQNGGSTQDAIRVSNQKINCSKKSTLVIQQIQKKSVVIKIKNNV